MHGVAFAPGLALLSLLVAEAFPLSGGTCEQLSAIALPGTTITLAQSLPAGSFAPPYGDSIAELPPFCRVAGVIQPTRDSHIQFEVWLPPNASWNGKFLGVGNGGFAGSIGYKSLAGNLKRGYATAATDTGHQGAGEDASWAFGHPEKIIDFGYRALHSTAENAKALIHAFYGQPAKRSYFDSCSNGGREALMEAQRFPADYDGILAGAPANNWTRMLTSGLDVAQQTIGKPAAILSQMKTPAITAAALAACDAKDGLKDGIISDPLHCRFDPSVLLCRGVESLACLTAPQIESLKKLYSGGRNLRGEQIFPGFVPGDEDPSWNEWVLGQGPGGSSGSVYLQNYFRYMVYQDPAWNPFTANLDDAAKAAEAKTAVALNATDPNLGAFQSRGGKLILYHGWDDPAIAPLNTLRYYENVKKAMGEKTESFVRLYMVPGMEHCIGGPGPSFFGQLGTRTTQGPAYGIYTALEEWVEKGIVPSDLIATKYASDPAKGAVMTRPICPYPQMAKYRGSGSPNAYTSFVCAPPPAP
jgi:hypothetical protein